MHDELTKDIYVEQAAIIFNVSLGNVTPEMKAFAKRAMYSMLYTTKR